jgi:hypothetical protein
MLRVWLWVWRLAIINGLGAAALWLSVVLVARAQMHPLLDTLPVVTIVILGLAMGMWAGVIASMLLDDSEDHSLPRLSAWIFGCGLMYGLGVVAMNEYPLPKALVLAVGAVIAGGGNVAFVADEFVKAVKNRLRAEREG